MVDFEITYKQYGEKAILITWPQFIDDDILEDIVAFKRVIIEHQESKLLDVINGYNSLLLLYRESFDVTTRIKEIKSIVSSRKRNTKEQGTGKWVIPVCYHESFGVDLKELALAKKITIEEIITLHKTPDYKVFCKGFLPGFMYLGGLNPALYFPRKATPRLKIAKNSVAIGGEQTGIYPSESPGGWQIIGRTPIALFDVNSTEVSPVKLGDTLNFKEISLTEYLAIESKNLKLTSGFEY